jgi:hypothetical protein
MVMLILTVPVALCLAGPLTSTLAQEADSDDWQHVVTQAYRAMSPEARAAEREARLEAKRDVAPAAPAPVAKTRAQVRAELAAARASGEFDAIHAEAPALGPAGAEAPRLLAQRR